MLGTFWLQLYPITYRDIGIALKKNIRTYSIGLLCLQEGRYSFHINEPAIKLIVRKLSFS